jgi:TolA-binding protein
MAWSLIELQQEEQAMTAFGRLLKRYPDSEFAASAQFTFGDYAYNRGDYEAAAEAYRTVQEKYSDAPVAKQVPRLLSELVEAIAYQEYEIGLALMDSADVTQNTVYFREAVQVFDQVQERFPGTESEIGALSNMGVCYEGLGEWREAVEVYEQVIGLYEEQLATKEAFQFAKSHRDWIVSTRL